MSRGDWRIIAAIVGLVAVVSLACWLTLKPGQPDIPVYQGLEAQGAQYRAGGSGCDPLRLQSLKGEAANERNRCAEAEEEHRLKSNDLVQQTRAANAAEAVARLTYNQSRLMVLQTIGGLITLFAAIFAAWYAKSAAEEARRGATAAERGVTHATEVSQTELRASLKSEHETFKPSGDKDREYIVALKIRNVGQTPAHGLVIYADAVYISNKGARAPFPSPPTYIGTLVHDADIDNPSTILLTARQLSAITNKRARVHINYRITFLDDFKVSWVYYQDLFVDHARSLAARPSPHSAVR